MLVVGRIICRSRRVAVTAIASERRRCGIPVIGSTRVTGHITTLTQNGIVVGADSRATEDNIVRTINMFCGPITGTIMAERTGITLFDMLGMFTNFFAAGGTTEVAIINDCSRCTGSITVAGTTGCCSGISPGRSGRTMTVDRRASQPTSSSVGRACGSCIAGCATIIGPGGVGG